MQFLDELTLQGENQSGELKSNVNFLRANTGRILPLLADYWIQHGYRKRAHHLSERLNYIRDIFDGKHPEDIELLTTA